MSNEFTILGNISLIHTSEIANNIFSSKEIDANNVTVRVKTYPKSIPAPAVIKTNARTNHQTYMMNPYYGKVERIEFSKVPNLPQYGNYYIRFATSFSPIIEAFGEFKEKGIFVIKYNHETIATLPANNGYTGPLSLD